MCQGCLDAIERYFPDLDAAGANDLLWNYTCFPFGTAEQTARQLREHRETIDAGGEIISDPCA